MGGVQGGRGRGRGRPRRGPPRPGGRTFDSFLREIPILVLIAFVIAIIIKTFLVQAFYIPSESMERTLAPGDRVLVSKLSDRFGDIHHENVVVVSNPNPAAVPDRGAVLVKTVYRVDLLQAPRQP